MSGNIYIPKPCHEDWNKMSPAEKGRHCEVCSKVVTDFSHMQKEQILTTLKDSTVELCGHIPLKHLTPSNKRQKIYFWFKGSFVPKLSYMFFGILGLAALFKRSAFAQTIDGQVVMMNGGAKYQAPDLQSKNIHVVVVDEKNHPVGDAVVSIKINNEVVNSSTTNTKGECTNSVEIASSGYSLVDIEVDAFGYQHKVVKQIRVSKANQTYRIKLDEEVIYLGKMMVVEPVTEVVIEQPETTCTRQTDQIIINQPAVVLIDPEPQVKLVEEVGFDNNPINENPNLFQLENNGLAFIAFPNPTMADLTIQSKEDVVFDVKIINANGAIIQETFNHSQRAQISLDGHAAGNYFVTIFINNKAIETHKIILIR